MISEPIQEKRISTQESSLKLHKKSTKVSLSTQNSSKTDFSEKTISFEQFLESKKNIVKRKKLSNQGNDSQRKQSMRS